MIEVKNNLNKRSLLLLLTAVLAIGTLGAYYVYAEGEEIIPKLEGSLIPFRFRWGACNMMGQLSEEQRSQLAADIQDLIATRMEEWGIERPEPLLSEEQRSELRAGIQELREAEATKEEIHEYITEKFAEWGVDLPEMPERHQEGRRFGKRGKGPRCFMKHTSNGKEP